MQNTVENAVKNVNIPRVKPEVALAFGIGTCLGSLGMTLVARHEQRKYTALVEKQSLRQHARFQYMMDNIAPYAPTEALTSLVTYLEADLMSSNEDGVDIGMTPPGEEPTIES